MDMFYIGFIILFAIALLLGKSLVCAGMKRWKARTVFGVILTVGCSSLLYVGTKAPLSTCVLVGVGFGAFAAYCSTGYRGGNKFDVLNPTDFHNLREGLEKIHWKTILLIILIMLFPFLVVFLLLKIVR